MEGPKGNGGEKPSADQNHSPNTPAAAGAGGDDVSAAAAAAVGRRPFTALSQEEADLALARVLQEQERAYMMLSAHGGDGSEYDASDAGSYDYYDEEEEGIEGDKGSDYEEEGVLPNDDDEEVGDAEGAELDPARYEDDEAYARALQDAEEREVAQRLMALAGITDLGEEMEHDEEDEEDGDSAQDAWEDVDPDEYSYEELVALGEVVGTESRGVSADTLASLPSVTYQAQDKQESNMEQCVICRVEFEEGESLVALPCKHSYHSDCINQWLQLNKVCPMCSAEVSTSDNNEA
ncbi:E3 ubiquitin ligase BIG BROTHER-related-like isoform X1 [Hordeum vulgare subsp. vulgare]|uniref:RING-type domain-containing protein n=1 Tax=Hordeum vulgare subsp. vulgare TaxID=112509 RepID=A0A8I7BED4_HORVV|nr:E3 ubiquitin ligase BIG BROTHER-related-like isoform X1 [Hordeum vulgare subsp. vulgare]